MISLVLSIEPPKSFYKSNKIKSIRHSHTYTHSNVGKYMELHVLTHWQDNSLLPMSRQLSWKWATTGHWKMIFSWVWYFLRTALFDLFFSLQHLPYPYINHPPHGCLFKLGHIAPVRFYACKSHEIQKTIMVAKLWFQHEDFGVATHKVLGLSFRV